MLLYYIIISFKFIISLTISSKLVIFSSHLGKMETLTVGNGGNPFCVNYGAIIYIFSDCWASSIFTLSFLIYPLSRAAGVARGSITNMCLGVKVAIKVLGLCLVGRRNYFIVGTR